VTAWRLGFSNRIDYSPFTALSLPLAISSSLERRIQLRCQLDAGSTFCVFQRQHGEALGLKVEDGIEQRIGTAHRADYYCIVPHVQFYFFLKAGLLQMKLGNADALRAAYSDYLRPHGYNVITETDPGSTRRISQAGIG